MLRYMWSLSFHYFTHVIECNAQMSIRTRNRETTVPTVLLGLVVPTGCNRLSVINYPPGDVIFA